MKILIIGGNRFFGKILVGNLLEQKHTVTLLNRGYMDDGWGPRVERIICDRRIISNLSNAVDGKKWDVVFDQVCFESQEAKDAVSIFRGKTPHYIFTSTQAVYGAGSNLNEGSFDPETHFSIKPISSSQSYSEAKRQCESIFCQSRLLPVTAVRFSIVAGADDYTGRFKFHVNRVKGRQAIYFQNPEAKISLISSSEAAAVLAFLADKKPVGPINASSPEPISLRNFISEIEAIVQKPVKLATAPDDSNQSPYGIESDWYMDIGKLISMGHKPLSIKDWLPAEVRGVLAAGNTT